MAIENCHQGRNDGPDQGTPGQMGPGWCPYTSFRTSGDILNMWDRVMSNLMTVPAPGNINANLGVLARRFSTVSDRFSGSWRRFPESWRQDGENGKKTGKKRAKMGEKWPKKSGGKLT